MDCRVASLLAMTGYMDGDIDMDGRWTCALVLMAGFSPELCNSVALFIQRAQGKPGAGGTRITVCGV